jgi:hypothetical protein
MGKRAPEDPTPQADRGEFGLERPQADRDIAATLSERELSEPHAQTLVVAEKRADLDLPPYRSTQRLKARRGMKSTSGVKTVRPACTGHSVSPGGSQRQPAEPYTQAAEIQIDTAHPEPINTICKSTAHV